MVLTSDVDWDPTVLDSEENNEEWPDSFLDSSSTAPQRPFDSFGDLKCTHALFTAATANIVDLDFCIPDDAFFEVFPRNLDSALPMLDTILDTDFQDDDLMFVHKVHRRPSVLLPLEPTITFDLESNKYVSTVPDQTSIGYGEPKKGPRRSPRLNKAAPDRPSFELQSPPHPDVPTAPDPTSTGHGEPKKDLYEKTVSSNDKKSVVCCRFCSTH